MDFITVIAWLFVAAVVACVLLWTFVLGMLLWDIGSAIYHNLRNKQ